MSVAITGVGLVTPLGRGADTVWTSVRSGRIGVREEPGRDGPAWARCVGRVEHVEAPPDVPEQLAGQTRFLNRGALLGTIAAHDALRQAAIPATVPAARRALYLAAGDHTKIGYEFLYAATRAATSGGTKPLDCETLNRSAIERTNPFFLLESINNNPFSFITAAFGFTGPGTSLASQSPCGSTALELACRTVRAGRADVALVVGCGTWVNDVPLFELSELGLLSHARSGVRSYRPFERRRDGFLAGEGGAAVVLEAEDRARERGGPLLAVVEGSGGCCEATARLQVPELATLRAMGLALADAGATAGDLGFLCAHGSGTRKGDRSELASILALFARDGSRVPVCGLKPYTGHMGAASDVAEVVLGIAAASEGIVPGTPNFGAPEPRFEELRISSSPQRCAAPRFLTASYGLGGQASAVVVRAGPDGARHG